ncbi:MAG: hypothetical protein RL563_1355 [Pseudomonadota bacterium]
MRNKAEQILNNISNHPFLYGYLILPSIVDFLGMSFDYRFYLLSQQFLRTSGLSMLSGAYLYLITAICFVVSILGCYLSTKTKQLLAIIFGFIINMMSFWLSMLEILVVSNGG